jgi:glycosyltransferase involved in cell wall biosynthesis
MKVGIFIPVYKESDQLEALIKTLITEPYPDKEIVVCVDEPTQKTKATIAEFEHIVKFRVSSERLGKVTALNKAVYETPCDTLLFLDSDVEIR